MIINGEWGSYEYDGVSKIRFLGMYDNVKYTGRYKKLARFVDSEGMPVCFKMADRDEDGWMRILPGSLQAEVGKPMKWIHYPPHPIPNYHGTTVMSIEE